MLEILLFTMESVYSVVFSTKSNLFVVEDKKGTYYCCASFSYTDFEFSFVKGCIGFIKEYCANKEDKYEQPTTNWSLQEFLSTSKERLRRRRRSGDAGGVPFWDRGKCKKYQSFMIFASAFSNLAHSEWIEKPWFFTVCMVQWCCEELHTFAQRTEGNYGKGLEHPKQCRWIFNLWEAGARGFHWGALWGRNALADPENDG